MADPVGGERFTAPLLHRLAAHTPLDVLTRVYSTIIVPSIRRRMRAEGVAPPAFRPLTDHADVLSPELVDALRRVGGIERVDTSLQRLERLALATSMALITKGPDRWKGRVTVEGLDAMVEASEDQPVFVIEPHIGPWWLVTGHLLHRGFRISVFSVAPPMEIKSFRRLASLLAAPGLPPDSFREIRVPDPGSAVTAIRDGKAGRVLMWNPGAVAFMGGASRKQPFLGGTVQVSPAIVRVLRRLGAAIFLAHARLEAQGPQRAHLVYRRLEVRLDDDDAALTDLYRAVEDTILENIDQWMMWRFFPEALQWTPPQR